MDNLSEVLAAAERFLGGYDNASDYYADAVILANEYVRVKDDLAERGLRATELTAEVARLREAVKAWDAARKSPDLTMEILFNAENDLLKAAKGVKS